MSEFLDPPALVRPIVINNDGGGLVDKYETAVRRYTLEGREVRIKGSCRSACILSLSVPNVCVYPGAVVKAHNAYEMDTGVRRPDVTARILSSLPYRVRLKLEGQVRDQYWKGSILTGSDLIKLGIRNCGDGNVTTVRSNNQNPVRDANTAGPQRTNDRAIFRQQTDCKWEKLWSVRCLLRL